MENACIDELVSEKRKNERMNDYYETKRNDTRSDDQRGH